MCGDQLELLSEPEKEKKLFSAIRKKRMNIFNALIDHNVNINCRDSDKKTPLHRAIENNSIEMVNELLKIGADINAKTNDDYFPIDLAIIFQNDPIILKMLIRYGADVNQEVFNVTPLVRAIKKTEPNADIVRCLLQHNANVNFKDNYKNTPLSYAVKSNNVKLIACLVSFGANIESELCYAIRHDLQHVINTIILVGKPNLNFKHPESPLHLAIQVGNLQLVQVLLDNGADKNMVNLSKETPLVVASKHNLIEAATFLLERGAGINIISEYVKSPLYYAIDNNNLKMIKLFLKHNAEINYQSDRMFPLLHATTSANREAVRYLLEKNVDPDQTLENESRPLYQAIQFNQQCIVEMLLTYGADVNFKINNGDSLLHYTVKQANCWSVKLLLENQANVNAENSDGLTPLELAKQTDKDVTKIIAFHLVKLDNLGLFISNKNEQMMKILYDHEMEQHLDACRWEVCKMRSDRIMTDHSESVIDLLIKPICEIFSIVKYDTLSEILRSRIGPNKYKKYSGMLTNRTNRIITLIKMKMKEQEKLYTI